VNARTPDSALKTENYSGAAFTSERKPLYPRDVVDLFHFVAMLRGMASV
jgi:hypothetical protein